MTQNELDETVRLHGLWLKGEKGGVKADLSGANLSHANLSYANLRGVWLCGANLSHAILINANLRGVNLSGANLSHANLSGVSLSGVNLSGVSLRGVNLSYVDLRGVDLSGIDLSGANLRGANLRDIGGVIIFQAGRHLAIAYNDMIGIGCEYHTISHWLKNYKTLGNDNGYTDTEIQMYYSFIKMIAFKYEAK